MIRLITFGAALRRPTSFTQRVAMAALALGLLAAGGIVVALGLTLLLGFLGAGALVGAGALAWRAITGRGARPGAGPVVRPVHRHGLDPSLEVFPVERPEDGRHSLPPGRPREDR